MKMKLNNFIEFVIMLFLFSLHSFVFSVGLDQIIQLNNIVERFCIMDFNYIVFLSDNKQYPFESLFDNDEYKKYIIECRNVNEEKEKVYALTQHFGANNNNYEEKLKLIAGFLMCKYLEQIKLINRLLLYLVDEYLRNLSEILLVENYTFLLDNYGIDIKHLLQVLENVNKHHSYKGNILEYKYSIEQLFNNKLKSSKKKCKFLKKIPLENKYKSIYFGPKFHLNNSPSYADFLAEMIDLTVKDSLQYNYYFTKNI
ncbi:uncharacterized protein LOC126904515 [Daktulosphaira vitifoliae]|uniref:uncharacterized protein LOC126904515 n=1 Tax=Daktulosphaira vitifoliae TaxID=58002 RepID=UPI0021AA5625|nr:uncharacterized protein LOC126904515 [Daktulosphaira vitifoliae]